MKSGATRVALRAWCALVVFSLAGTLLSFLHPERVASVAIGLGILTVAWAKARLILLYYLGLTDAPRWRTGGVASITVAVLVFAALFLVGYGAAP